MASKQTYECYICKKNGFADTRVYLDGKTEDGKTIYKNEDMSPHQHRVSTETVQKQQQSSTVRREKPQTEQPTKPQASTTIVTQATNEPRILSKLDELEQKIEHLTKLVYIQTQLLQQKAQQQEQTIEQK